MKGNPHHDEGSSDDGSQPLSFYRNGNLPRQLTSNREEQEHDSRYDQDRGIRVSFSAAIALSITHLALGT